MSNTLTFDLGTITYVGQTVQMQPGSDVTIEIIVPIVPIVIIVPVVVVIVAMLLILMVVVVVLFSVLYVYKSKSRKREHHLTVQKPLEIEMK